MQFVVGLYGEVLCFVFLWIGVWCGVFDECVWCDGCWWEVLVFFDVDEVVFVGFGDDGFCEYSFYGFVFLDVGKSV